MTKLYDFNAHRASRLQGNYSRQTEKVQRDVDDFANKFKVMEDMIEQSGQTLEELEIKLQEYHQSCVKTVELDREVQEVMDRDDIDELINLRNRLMKADD